MAENKRFECNKGSRIIIDNETKLHYIMTLDWECSLVTKLLNRFVDENEQLKQEYLKLKHRHSLLHDECLDTECERDSLKKDVNSLEEENEQLKSTNMEYEDALGRLEEENKQQKRFLKIHDDYYLQYGDDNELFDLHKPADIRSLCIILNREHGFSELQCEYNDKEYGE